MIPHLVPEIEGGYPERDGGAEEEGQGWGDSRRLICNLVSQMLIEKSRQGALTPWLRQQQWLAGKSAKPGTTAAALTLRLTRRASLLVQCCWYTRLSWNTQIGVRIDKRAESSGRVADGTLWPNRAPTTVHPTLYHCLLSHIVLRCAIPHCATVCDTTDASWNWLPAGPPPPHQVEGEGWMWRRSN